MSSNIVKGIETKSGLANEGLARVLEMEDGLLLTKDHYLASKFSFDASNRLECSVDALEITAETINLSTNELDSEIENKLNQVLNGL